MVFEEGLCSMELISLLLLLVVVVVAAAVTSCLGCYFHYVFALHVGEK